MGGNDSPYLEGLIKEGLDSLRQASNEPEWIPQHVQAQHQHIHLLQELWRGEGASGRSQTNKMPQ